MSETLWWVLLALVATNLVVALVGLFRPQRGVEVAAREVRDELRSGREEAGTAARALREETAGAWRSASEAMNTMLVDFAGRQHSLLAGMSDHLRELAGSNQASLEQIRATIEGRVKELQEGNERRLLDMRREAAEGLKTTSETLSAKLEERGLGQQRELESMNRQLRELAEAIQQSLDRVRDTFDERVRELQEGNEKRLVEMRSEAATGLKATSETVTASLQQMAHGQQGQLEDMTKQLRDMATSNQQALDRIRDTFDGRVKELQDGNERRLVEMRREAAEGLATASHTLSQALQEMELGQQLQLEDMTRQLKELVEANQVALDRVRETFDARVKALQEGNEQKLDEMRRTVDEKLHDTLEKRLGESFKLVSDRLEAVHKGLGEMQTLATGVGDLKRVLSNVKARGTWAEVQLGALLEQVLTPEQYGRNICVKDGTTERVEYAICLPGSKGDPASRVWLPIDSKFPQEDYVRLQDAAEQGDSEAVQAASEALGRAVRAAAKDIHDKYVNPPNTTDFAILFLATEGLYAELLRQPALVEDLQQRYRIVLSGPTTLVALLSSLRMGFQTLAIEQQAAEVWRVLGAVKTEFGKFGDALDKVGRQLDSASKTIVNTGVRTRAIQRSLRTVEQLPQGEASTVLGLPGTLLAADDANDVADEEYLEA
jgi:DNA recombination protein RmuC